MDINQVIADFEQYRNTPYSGGMFEGIVMLLDEVAKQTARVAELEERQDDLQTVLTRLREAEVEPTKLWQRANGHDGGFFPGFTELFQWMTAEITRLRAALAKYAEMD